jgi:hypothetical protein
MPDSGDDFVVTIAGMLSELVASLESAGQQAAATAEQVDAAFAATGAQLVNSPIKFETALGSKLSEWDR